MNKSVKLLSLAAAAAVLFAVISWGGTAQAQQSKPNSGQSQTAPPPSQPPDSSQQSPSQNPPSQPPDQQAPSTRQGQADPGQTPDQTAPSGRSQDQAQSDAGSGKEFVGTVVKQGNKYMFQEAASGQTYDIDHQEEVKKFDGKKVRVRGTLDPQTKTIHVQ